MTDRKAQRARLFSFLAGTTLAMSASVVMPPEATATEAASAAIGQTTITGITTPDLREFLGIRYAQPPVGALRWQPPQPAVAISSKADAFGPHCPQNASPFGMASTSEDCLFLNVFTPLNASAERRDLPVMVWIHGGDLTEGESDDFNPVRLVEQGVIVVTINYRLGALGFLAQKALDAEKHPGVNYGLLDQQAALKWVQDNIGGFGGNPRNVTIFGESAGGQSVLSHLVSPGARSLFARAINESGAYALILPPLAEGEAQGAAFATAAGCADQTAACLRQLPVATILANQGPGFQTAIVDGTVMPQSIDTALRTGEFNRVPVLSGSNQDEGRLFVAEEFDLSGAPLDAAEYAPVVQSDLASIADAVLQQYPLNAFPSADLAVASVLTDALFACNTLRVSTLAAPFTLIFEYEFSDTQAPEIFLPPVSFPYGATHASELQFLFDFAPQPDTNETAPLTPREQDLARAMVRYWTNFAKDSDPNGTSVPEWTQVQADGVGIQSLVPGITNRFDFSTEHRCDFWNPIISTQALPLSF
jgi:para-nitrobenzyl esterase